MIGIASGVTVIMHRRADGATTFRSGWISGFFWVLGMGSRFAFAWLGHARRRQLDRELQRHASHHQRRGVDRGAAGDGGLRGLRPHADPWRCAGRAPDALTDRPGIGA